jgi:UDP-glucose 4-epimerase
LEPMDAPEGSISIQGDVRDAGLVSYAVQGCDAVIHAAAYHSDALPKRSEGDFYDVNITGTHNVLRAMMLHGVKNLVFSSTDAVYGDGMRENHVMDEETPCIPNNFFGMTKRVCEEMCEFYARKCHIRTAILRYGSFVPTDRHIMGLGRLCQYMDREDVAQANLLALGAVASEEITCETFLIHSAKPFAPEDWPEMEYDPKEVVERYYPGTVELLAKHGLHVPRIPYLPVINKAIETLGYDPQHNFEQFLSELRRSA